MLVLMVIHIMAIMTSLHNNICEKCESSISSHITPGENDQCSSYINLLKLCSIKDFVIRYVATK